MRNIFLNRKLRQKAGCRIELPVVSNHLGGISPGENCPGVIVCGVTILEGHCGVGNLLGVIFLGGLLPGGNFFSKLQH